MSLLPHLPIANVGDYLRFAGCSLLAVAAIFVAGFIRDSLKRKGGKL